jgi:peptide/nickel transport system substrate-binding protein
MERPGVARPLALALTAALIALSGCGDDDDTDADAPSGLPAAGGGGPLAYALPDLPPVLDPLAASDRAELTVVRQVHEPLVELLRGPYGEGSPQPGLALTVTPSRDRTIWTVALRPDVRFQDGTPFNAAAVLANARRWDSDPRGSELLPNLFAVDAPRPDEVRFLLDEPVPDLARRLSDPRLGIVSPLALEPQSGERASFRGESSGSGTGAFEPGLVSAGRIELSRYAGWWGTPLGLGPALDGVAFVLAPDSGERLRLLADGSVQIADPLDRAGLDAADADPLLATVGGPVSGIGLERSVRGIDSARAVPLLSGVWLTRLVG